MDIIVGCRLLYLCPMELRFVSSLVKARYYPLYSAGTTASTCQMLPLLWLDDRDFAAVIVDSLLCCC